MPARSVEITTAIAALLTTELDGEATVTRTDIPIVELESLTGRQVLVMDLSEADGGPATRDKDYRLYTVAIIVLERYTGNGLPGQGWIDDRKEWTVDSVFDLLNDPREPILPGVYAFESPVVNIKADPEILLESHVFYSEIHLVFREAKQR
jgi:hypothetical protein